MVSGCSFLHFFLICLSGFHMLSRVFKNNPPMILERYSPVVMRGVVTYTVH